MADGEKRRKREEEIIWNAHNRMAVRQKLRSVRPDGMDFMGLKERLAALEFEHERWRVLADHSKKMIRTNVWVAEFITSTRLVAETTLYLLRADEMMEGRDRIFNHAKVVREFLKDVWLFGVHPSEKVNRHIDYLSFVTLQAVVAVAEFRESLVSQRPGVKVVERGIVPLSLVDRPMIGWTLLDFMLALDVAVSQWSNLVLDEVLAKYIDDMRRQYCKLVMAEFGESTEVLNYGAVGHASTPHGNVVCIGVDTDKRVCAVMREMYTDLFRRQRLVSQFRVKEKPPPFPKEAYGPISRWMSLNSVTTTGSASNIVLKRFRTSFYYFFPRPGMTERYNNENAHRVGEEFRSKRKPTVEAITAQRELEFNALFPSEAGAFSKKFLDAGPLDIVAANGDGAFGSSAYMLVFLFAFSHTFSMHMAQQWLDLYFLDCPLPHHLSERDGRCFILVVRCKGEYYVVHTDTMTAYPCENIFHAIFTWMLHFAENDLAPVAKTTVTELFEQIFVRGEYELMTNHREQNVYHGNPLIRGDVCMHIISGHQ